MKKRKSHILKVLYIHLPEYKLYLNQRRTIPKKIIIKFIKSVFKDLKSLLLVKSKGLLKTKGLIGIFKAIIVIKSRNFTFSRN